MASAEDWSVPVEFQPKQSGLTYRLDEALSSIVGLRATVPSDAYTAEISVAAGIDAGHEPVREPLARGAVRTPGEHAVQVLPVFRHHINAAAPGKPCTFKIGRIT